MTQIKSLGFRIGLVISAIRVIRSILRYSSALFGQGVGGFGYALELWFTLQIK